MSDSYLGARLREAVAEEQQRVADDQFWPNEVSKVEHERDDARRMRDSARAEIERLHDAIDVMNGCRLDDQETIERLREALRDIAAMPLDGDYDYSPGVSERLAAADALVVPENDGRAA